MVGRMDGAVLATIWSLILRSLPRWHQAFEFFKPFPSEDVGHWAPYRATTPNIMCRGQSPRNRARILGKVHKGLKASSQETVISETETPWLWSQAMTQSVLRECKRHDGIAQLCAHAAMFLSGNHDVLFPALELLFLPCIFLVSDTNPKKSPKKATRKAPGDNENG